MWGVEGEVRNRNDEKNVWWHVTQAVSGKNKRIDLFKAFFQLFDMDKLGGKRRHHWNERLKNSKIAQFESDFLKTKEDIAP